MMMRRVFKQSAMKLIGVGIILLMQSACATATKKQPFTFVQICDTQLGMGGYQHDVDTFTRAVEQINALNPDFVVICGDLVHDRNAASFSDFKRIKSAFTVPCYCVPGNHDVGNEPSKESLRNYREVIGADHSSFEHKGYTFALVNTQLWKGPLAGETVVQDAWLVQTLAAAKKKESPVFVVGHYPLFLEQPMESEKYSNLPQAKRAELLALFEPYGVVAMLGGHTHRLIINDYKGIQLVNGETTSKNFDKRPMGFRLWSIAGQRPFLHEFIPVKVDGVESPSTTLELP